MVDFNFDGQRGILSVRPQAALEAADFATLAGAVDPYIEAGGTLCAIIIEAPKFPGWDSLGAMAAHFRFVRDHHRHVERVALVTDSTLGEAAARLAAHFVSAEVRSFSTSESASARAWAATGA